VEAGAQNLETLRKESQKDGFFHRHCPFLFNIHSLFYYGLFIFVVGIAWTLYSLVTDNGTQLYNWDYNSQYVSFTYNFWDTWHTFFKTGYFELYNASTYLGTDNIGSNAYYGLFDPFLIVCYLFPRAWVPQTFAFATFFKTMAAAFGMRAYLKYMKVSEGSSRLGGLIFAYCGFVNFFVGFPSFISIVCLVPLILLGIEKVLQEKKISCLVWSLFFMGLISFFFLVVLCIWGVIYAIWRFFSLLKTYSKKDIWQVMGLGVLSFALGLMLCSWVLLPSFRESSLSGRTTSVGAAYLNVIKTAFAEKDFKTVVGMLFAPVGDNAERELVGLISFFYPTCNYLYLPLAGSKTLVASYGKNYDAWTSSLFCYTPMVIMFFSAFVSSIRRHQWRHLVAIALCCYLLFTTFAYYAFFAFAGDGYGRWFIVLVPLIIYYGCQEIDRLKEEPPYVLPLGSFLAVALTAATYGITYAVLNGQTFTSVDIYSIPSYNVPAVTIDKSGIEHSLLWLVNYQLGLVVIESLVIFYFQKKPNLWKVLSGFVTMEIIVAGNISFAYGSLWSFDKLFLGGVSQAERTEQVFSNLSSFDDSFYRVESDSYPNSNASMVFSFNGAGNFHSLYNYDTSALSRQSHIIGNDSTYQRYGQTITAKSWSGWYGNKRFGLDTALGTKYYVVANDFYPTNTDGDTSSWEYQPANVPFGSQEVTSLSTPYFKVYENPYFDKVPLGHAVDTIYQENRVAGSTDSDFYGHYHYDGASGNSLSDYEMLKNEDVYLNGAIVKDSDAEEVSQKFMISPSPSTSLASTMYMQYSYRGRYLETFSGTTNGGKDSYDYTYYGVHSTLGEDGRYTIDKYYDPAYFLTHTSDETVIAKDSDGAFIDKARVSGNMKQDYGKQVYYPTTGWGSYFNQDPQGNYFAITFPSIQKNANLAPRVYFVGDTYQEDGVSLKQENVVLSYEWSSLENWRNLGADCDYTSKTFGFYAPGRVKWIVFCDGKDGGYVNGQPSGSAATAAPLIYGCSRKLIDQQIDKLSSQEYALSDVSYSKRGISFQSNYSSEKMVVTCLGYDAGWKVATKDDTGKLTYLKTYNLDGGFVGFIAPSGETDYVMVYETPYLKVGVALAMTAFVIYITYTAGYTISETKRLKKEMALALEGKKKEEGNHPLPPSGS
jgi:hypothetical protein